MRLEQPPLSTGHSFQHRYEPRAPVRVEAAAARYAALAFDPVGQLAPRVAVMGRLSRSAPFQRGPGLGARNVEEEKEVLLRGGGCE